MTPHGESCVSEVDQVKPMLLVQAKGSWQKEVVSNLVSSGYIVGYRATGMLRGKARKYQSHYARSLTNLMTRIENRLMTTDFVLCYGQVGPKGGYGYYITER